MLYNLIAFTLFFAVFGTIIFAQMKTTLFAKTDSELMNSRDMIQSGFKNTSESSEQPERNSTRNKGVPSPLEPRQGFSPRIILIEWDASGKIMNAQQMGMRYYEIFQNLKLDKQTLNSISEITIDSTYHFRTISVKNPLVNGDIIQLVINVDAEQNLVDHFKQIIILCSAIFILLSITVSFFLSKKTMKPIINSWNRQVEFVENASHELRTPLTIIQNKLELLQTTPDKKIMDRFENIALSLSETRRLSRLTTDLMTLARADSTETQLEKQSIDLDTFIDNVCSPYMEIAEMQDKKVYLQLNSQTKVMADSGRMHQLMVILLDNALKYTGEHDRITISTSLQENKIVIEVSDTGIGISEAGIGRVFDRFYREDRARTRGSGGSGLGLSIAQWIVQSHNGTIQAIHNEPKGMIFRIKLPK